MTIYSVQPKDSDLDAIAALVTTSFGRALLAAVDLPALQSILGSGTPSSSTYLRGDGTWSTPPTGDGGGAVDSVNGQTGDITLTATDVGAQPVDSDLTAIAALTTTGFGRSVLAASDAAALRVLAGAIIGTDVQAFDSDLQAIAALTTTAFGRGLLTEASAASARTTLGLVIGTDVQAQSAELSILAALTSTTLGRAVLESSNASQVRTLINAQSLDTDLTAIAALVSAADKLPYATGAGTWALADFGSFARGLNALTTASAVRTYLGLVIGTDVQAFNSGLTSIAALTTTSYGRNFLTLANLAAVQALLGTGTPSNTTYLRGDGTWATPSAGPAGVIATDTLWDAAGDLVVGTGADTATKLTLGAASTFLRVNSGATGLEYAALVDADIPAAIARDAEVAAGYQPLDSDLTAIAALTTTAYGRSLLAAADAPALRVLAGLVIGADVQAYDADLASIALLTTTSYGRSILTVADATALRAYASLVIGTNVQAWSAKLDTFAGLTGATDALPYFTSSTTMGTTTLTSYARTLLDDTTAATARTTLGLGTAATVNTGAASGDVALLGTGGRFDIARLASGTATGSKFVRDDGTLAVPAGGGSTPEGLVSGVINATDATYGMVADGLRITDAALTAGASPVLTSASSPFVSGDVGKVVQLYRDVVIPDASITSGTAVLTSASNAVPTWVQPGMPIHVSAAGTSGNTLSTTVLTNDSTGQLTLAANAVTTVTSTTSSPKGAIVWGLFKSTVASYSGVGSVTLSGTSSYTFTGATAVWGTDNRAAFAAAAAAAVTANKPLDVPAGNFVIFLNSTNPNAMAAPTSATFRLRGGGRSKTNFMIVTDGLTAAVTSFVRRGSDCSLELNDWKLQYFGPQTTNGNNVFSAVQANGVGTADRVLSMTRVDFDSTYRPSIGINCGAGTGLANARITLDDCKSYAVQSASLLLFVNPSRQVATGVTTSGSPTVTGTGLALTVNDLGKLVTSGTAAIPSRSYIGKINSTTSFELSSSPIRNTPVNATASTTSNTLTVAGGDAELRATNCRFDTNLALITDTNDNQYNPHATYIHPSVNVAFKSCVFCTSSISGSVYALHGNGTPDDATRFWMMDSCQVEGKGAILIRGNVTMASLRNCDFTRGGGIATAADTEIMGCSMGSGSIVIDGTGKTVRITQPKWTSTAVASSGMILANSAGAGTHVVLQDMDLAWPSTNWTQLFGVPTSAAVRFDLVNVNISGITGSSNGIMEAKGAVKTNVRGGSYAGGSAMGLFWSTAAAGSVTGHIRFEGVDFTGITGTAIFDQTTTGTDGPFRVINCLFGSATAPTNSAGRTGNQFAARPFTSPTAVTSANPLVLDHDYAQYTCSASAINVDNIYRSTAVRTKMCSEVVTLRNTHASNAITLKHGTGNLRCTGAADLTCAAGTIVQLIADGAGFWDVRSLG